MSARGQVALPASRYPVTAFFLHGGETAHVEAGAEGTAFAGQYYRPQALFVSQPVGGSHQRVEHRGIERIHLVRPHQTDVGDAIRNRHRNALLHGRCLLLFFVVAALQKGVVRI
jgi:hypothetical protein